MFPFTSSSGRESRVGEQEKHSICPAVLRCRLQILHANTPFCCPFSLCFSARRLHEITRAAGWDFSQNKNSRHITHGRTPSTQQAHQGTHRHPVIPSRIEHHECQSNPGARRLAVTPSVRQSGRRSGATSHKEFTRCFETSHNEQCDK